MFTLLQSLIGLVVFVYVKHHVYLLQSLIGLVVFVYVKHHVYLLQSPSQDLTAGVGGQLA